MKSQEITHSLENNMKKCSWYKIEGCQERTKYNACKWILVQDEVIFSFKYYDKESWNINKQQYDVIQMGVFERCIW